MATIDMQTMRYINLLDKISRIKTKKCFVYNNSIIFVVSARDVSRAVGPSGKNIRLMQEQLGKKVKIIEDAHDQGGAERFIEDIVSPVTFVSLDLKEGVFILTAGTRSKAALLGRNKRRLLELAKIVEDNFGKELRIV
jgi:NusA-like KH domain protein